MNQIIIDGRKIGPGHEPYIIAEISANHNGDLSKALDIMEAAAKAGADAIKIQTYTADTITLNHDSEQFKIQGGLWDGRTLYDLYEEAHTPWEWHEALFDHAKKLGVTLFSSPFDDTAVELLEKLDAPAYKIASFELIDIPLIRRVAQTGKPIIMSTGMANIEEISEAVEAARSNGCSQLALLHCISGYPTPVEQANVKTIPELISKFNVVTGLSDHTLSNATSIAAVALGANIIEKHFITSRSEEGPDSEFSIEPHELTALCKDSKDAWHALGTSGFELKSAESANLQFRRSLYITKAIKKGELLTKHNIRSIRPGFGLKPKHLDEVLGKKAKGDLTRGTALSWEMIDK